MGAGSKPGERRGGRAKGAMNKISLDLLEELRAKNFNPAAELVEIIKDARDEYARSQEIHDAIQENRDEAKIKGYFADTGPAYLGIAAKACADLMKFVYPTRKAIDHTSGGESFNQSFVDVVKAVMQSTSNDTGKPSAGNSTIPEKS